MRPDIDTLSKIYEGYDETSIKSMARSGWREYYEKKIGTRFLDEGGIKYYQERREAENRPYLETILDNVESPTDVVGVVGSGAGLEIVYLLKKGVKTIGLDNEDVFPLVRQNAKLANVSESMLFGFTDLRKLGLADQSLRVLASHGTLEHFERDEDIVDAIIEGCRVANTYIFVVPLELAGNLDARRSLNLSMPTENNTTGNFGNEVYKNGTEWESVIQTAIKKMRQEGVEITTENPFGYWIPEYGDTKKHPQTREEAERLYKSGKSIYGVYVLKRTHNTP